MYMSKVHMLDPTRTSTKALCQATIYIFDTTLLPCAPHYNNNAECEWTFSYLSVHGHLKYIILWESILARSRACFKDATINYIVHKYDDLLLRWDVNSCPFVARNDIEPCSTRRVSAAKQNAVSVLQTPTGSEIFSHRYWLSSALC